MLTSAQWSQLIEPVVCRAQADLNARVSGFVDRTALLVLHRLGYAWSQEDQYRWMRQRQQLKREQWIDHQAIQFFKKYPRAIGLEVDSGLSTRFHRISAALDWPQFRWDTVNRPLIGDYLGFIFPTTDNYTNITCENPILDWPKKINNPTQNHYLVVIGESFPVDNLSQFITLIETFERHCHATSASVQICISHTIKHFENAIQGLSKHVIIRDQYRQRRPFYRILNGLNNLFNLQFNLYEEIMIHHLSFEVRPQTREVEMDESGQSISPSLLGNISQT